jgi:3-oxoadipate enol-lactonase
MRCAVFLTCVLFAAPTLAELLEVNGGKLSYEVAGSGHAVVLLHGGQMDSRMWDEQFGRYAKLYRTIRFDVRGYGKSPAPTVPYASEEDLAALLRHLGVTKTCLVGLSLGGRIAIDFTLVHPEMVDGLVAVAPGLSGFHYSDDPSGLEIWHAAQAGDWDKATETWLKSGYMAPAMENAKLAPRLRQLARENVRQNLDNGALERWLDPPAFGRLREIKVPTLILVGSRDVSNIHQICGLLYAQVQGAGEIVFPGAGHILNMEQPEPFDRAVLEFLGKLESP